MTILDDFASTLLFRRSVTPPPTRDIERLSDGVYHVDQHDEDHVYLLTVQCIPRVRLEFDRPFTVGEIAGVPADLVEVTVANHVEVTLDATPGAQRFDEGAPSGSSPAEELAQITVTVADDAGTSYQLTSGQAGGPGTEWQVRWNFQPAPPPTARHLTLHFTAPGTAPAEIRLPLPAN
ncbi:hypothetical protein [Paractinoplanes durhamensis]|uniref:hypothetical protein n=1 Tax=Paractinoplanes durhamensis TaxID=113563 RepID=UPI001942544C|nr:hypothetical protein [Actinoplanes durhamensis]